MGYIKKIKFSRITTLLATVVVFGFSANPASALTISPPKLEVSSNPGEVVTQTIKLFNEEARENVFYTEVQNFTARGEFGEPGFVENSEEDGSSLADWIEISPRPIVLAAGERKEINFEIQIPKNADPGGHYAGVLFSTTPPGQEIGNSAIGISGKIGALVLLRIAGEVQESGKLLEFDTMDGKRLFSSRPVQFYARFQNLGNVHLKPLGEIKIKGIFDVTSTPDTLAVNDAGGNVLSNSIRRFDSVWGKSGTTQISEDDGFFAGLKNEWKNFAFGKFQADLVLSFGSEGQQVTKSIEFWIIPWRIITCLVIILLLIFVVLKIGIKRYNKWIVKKAKAIV